MLALIIKHLEQQMSKMTKTERNLNFNYKVSSFHECLPDKTVRATEATTDSEESLKESTENGRKTKLQYPFSFITSLIT